MEKKGIVMVGKQGGRKGKGKGKQEERQRVTSQGSVRAEEAESFPDF